MGPVGPIGPQLAGRAQPAEERNGALRRKRIAGLGAESAAEQSRAGQGGSQQAELPTLHTRACKLAPSVLFVVWGTFIETG
jgi:hypothetical protein